MGKMRYICHPELRRRGKGPETSMRRKAIPRKMKRHKCLVNMFAGPYRSKGQREEFLQTDLAQFFLSTTLSMLYFSIVVALFLEQVSY